LITPTNDVNNHLFPLEASYRLLLARGTASADQINSHGYAAGQIPIISGGTNIVTSTAIEGLCVIICFYDYINYL
jgi:hypothetical protein